MAVRAVIRAQYLLENGNAAARAAGLRWVSTDEPGYTRLRRGRVFSYRDLEGRTLRDRDTLARIRALAIPPAWTAVWICPDPDGHVQACGRDARARKQFRYHPRWRALRDEAKHTRVRAFGGSLPALRARVARDLRCSCLCREVVSAAIVTLLDRGHLRIGSEEYARDNGSHGACTLTCRDVRVAGPVIQFAFTGKAGVRHRVEVEEAGLAKVVERCRRLRGARLFQYLGDDGKPHLVTSRDVNEYLRERTGGSFSAKDFRTWHASKLCAQLLPKTPAATERGRKRELVGVIAQVAAALGNTPAVCRRSYIDPELIDRFLRA